MRKILAASMVAALLAVAGPAFADVAGTGEGGTGAGDNNVNCDKSSTAQRQNVAGGIFIAAEGNQAAPQNGGAIVLCNEGNTANGAPTPVQGRVIVKGGTGGGYVAADGDKDNDPNAQGWARLNIGTTPGVNCGGPADAGTNNNAETNGGTQAACG